MSIEHRQSAEHPPRVPSGSLETLRQLLQAVVETARAIFAAAAASVLTYQPASDELVFSAVSGEGEHDLVGRRISADTGIAGWVLQTEQPVLLDDLSNNAAFSRATAKSTGYVPSSMMAAPLPGESGCVGVLEVLDRTADSRGEMNDINLLALFGRQAALAIELVPEPRPFDPVTSYERLANSVGQNLTRLSRMERAASLEVLHAMNELLFARRESSGR
jgi:GAF domain